MSKQEIKENLVVAKTAIAVLQNRVNTEKLSDLEIRAYDDLVLAKHYLALASMKLGIRF